jgi:two-component system NarL family sensor kinase
VKTVPFRGVRAVLPRRRKPMTPAGAMFRFAAAALLATTVVGVVVGGQLHQQAMKAAIADAREVTLRDAHNVVAPLLTRAALNGDPQAVTALDAVVREKVLDERVVRVKVWTSDGRVVYADQPGVAGNTYPLGDDEKQALTEGTAAVEVSDGHDDENAGDRMTSQVIEVYQGMPTPAGQNVLYEAYLSYDTVAAAGRYELSQVGPVFFGGLVMLWLLQLPVAWQLTHALARGRAAREMLLQRAVSAAETERRRIAADLHDSVVQTVAGVALNVSTAAHRTADSEMAGSLRADAGLLRQAVRELRTLIVTIAPPRLHEEGLAAAVDDLLSTLRQQGITANCDVSVPALPRTRELLLFRVAQESLRNVIRTGPRNPDHPGGSRR